MKFGLLRHAKVLFAKHLFSTGNSYNDFIEDYEHAEVENLNFKIPIQEFPICFVSSLPRAIKTAEMVYEGSFTITDELREVDNKSIYYKNVITPTLLRSAAQRIGWYLNSSKVAETRHESNRRADDLLKKLLLTSHNNTLLITHGLFMHCLMRALKEKGFEGKRIYIPKNATLYVFENKKLK